MEKWLLALFAAGLLGCVFTGHSILAALLVGYFLFFGYGLVKKHPFREMLSFSLQGIQTVQNILITFFLIGVLTAVWRACGSIALIVYEISALCMPSAMVLLTFLLCCLISFLTGTAFGSAATIGVICMTMAAGMGVSPLYTGGAILAGVYFGDRCSPVSTSALLVSELTKTDLLQNIKTMVKTSLVPFFLSCVLYLYLGTGVRGTASPEAVRALFQAQYRLSPLALLPVAAVLVLSLCRVNVKITLAAGAVLGAAAAVFIQDFPPARLPALFLFGFCPADADLAALMSGGGILSMVKVFCIVCISSCYAGIFRGTGFLNGIQDAIRALAGTLSVFGATALIAVVSSCIACNQTLAIMLTHQLCGRNYEDAPSLASDLENTAVVIAPLIPWSIAGAVPLATVDAPLGSIRFSFYLFLLPLCSLAAHIWKRAKTHHAPPV